VGQEDHEPVASYAPQLPQLVALQAELLLGVPVGGLNPPASQVRLDYCLNVPVKPVRRQNLRLTLQLWVLVGDDDPNPPS